MMAPFYFQLLISVAMIFWGLATSAVAQPPDAGDRLKQLDANGNGQIEPDEIPDRIRPFLHGRAREAGLDVSKPQSVEQWAKVVSRRRDDGDRSYRDGRDDDRQPDERKDEGDFQGDFSKAEAIVPGFGVEQDLPTVPGFGHDESAGDGRGVRAAGVPIEDRYGSRVISYVDGILRRYDRNENGELDESEWRRARWRSSPEASDLNKDNILSREELCERVSKYSEFSGSGSESTSSRSGSDDNRKYREYAKGLLKRYDENKNGVLEKDEWSRMSSFHRGADFNRDGAITSDELAQRLASYGKNDSQSSSSGSGSRSSTSDNNQPGKSYTVTGERREPYRSKTATERLPKGLPDWFTRNDADGDGQIQMSEFAVSWDDEKLEKFNQFDKNRDGIITASEGSGEAGPSREPSKSGSTPRSRESWSRYRRR